MSAASTIAWSMALAMLAPLPATASQAPFRPPIFKPSPKVDARGFIDVWQLRRDVAQVEVRYAGDDTDRCSVEGDPDENPTRAQLRRWALETKACVARINRAHANYQRVFSAFNRAWLPVIRDAVSKGDRVAEVIWRNCETTSALDRSGIESTCDEEPRKSVASRRVTEIGFVPAFDLANQIVGWQHSPGLRETRAAQQKMALYDIQHGVLGFDRGNVSIGGNLARNAIDLEAYQRYAVIEAALQDAPRAFTFSPGSDSAGWKTNAFARLRLNRKPLTPGYMTWGRALYYGGGNGLWTGPHYWRSSPTLVYIEGQRGERAMSGKGVVEFERALSETLAVAEANIDRYLKEDPRWGVFLLQRIGHHEWVPEGMKSTTHHLDAAWQGVWLLEKAAMEKEVGMEPRVGKAIIKRAGGRTQISVQSEGSADPFADVTDCTLRYSGGSTFIPRGQDDTNTALGYFPRLNNAFMAPLDPKKSYRQVLMQCEGAEWHDTDRVRFLLLAGDVLIEVGNASGRQPVLVRHFRRQR